jgi:hypothetical protein
MGNLRQQAEAETTSKPEVKVGKLQSRNTFESRHQETNDTDSVKVKYLLIYIYIYIYLLFTYIDETEELNVKLSFLNEAAKNTGKFIVFLTCFSEQNKRRSTDIVFLKFYNFTLNYLRTVLRHTT